MVATPSFCGLHTLLFYLALIHTDIHGFNIDLKYPVIIRNRAGISSRVPNYFGANVKLLKADQGDAWAIIGAPKANSTLRAHSRIDEPGVVWQCSLGRDEEICRPLIMDPEGNSYDAERRYQYRKDHGLLGAPEGVALSSTSFVACASGFEKRDTTETTSYLHGACYSRPRSQLFEMPLPAPLSNHKMIPLEEPAIERERNTKFGFAGFSVHLPRSGGELVMGAPGRETEKGSIIQYLSKDGGATFTKQYISDALKTTGEFNYLGYSLTSGHFFEPTVSLQYAASAPRGASLTGKVVIFRFPEKASDPLMVLEELKGDQTGGYFGASLLALDINDDGIDDLLVGAPRYSRGQSSMKVMDSMKSGRSGGFGGDVGARLYERFAGYGDEGAVYVFLSTGVTFTRQKDVLHGDNRPSGQFGTAITSLGDLNRDGYNDFAVSAPFEGSGAGAIYIYHGSSTGQITKYSQVIRASQIDKDLRGFGFSLVGGHDIDNNGFTDIAIGSFNSSQTVVLRSKPVITVYGKMQSEKSKLPLDVEAFNIKSCVSYTGDYAPGSLLLGVRLRSDSNFRPERIQLMYSDGRAPGFQSSFIEYNITLRKDREHCTNFDAKVIRPLESSGEAVVFRQVIYNPDSVGNVLRPRVMEIQQDGNVSISGEAFNSFCKTCPILNLAKSIDFTLELPLEVKCGSDDRCDSDLRLDVSFKNLTIKKGFLIGSSPTVEMEVTLSNLRETAIAPAILVSWQRLVLKRIPTGCFPFSEIANLITYKCQLGRVLEEGKSASVSLEFDMSSLIVSDPMTDRVVFSVNATTASEIIFPEHASTNIFLPLYASADLHISGNRYLEPFNDKTVIPFIVFKHDFQINLDGPSSVANVIAVFDLPVNLTTSSNGTVVNVRGVETDGYLQCQPTKGNFAQSDLISSSSSDLEEDPNFEFAGIGTKLSDNEDVSRKSNTSFVEKDKLLLHCNSPYVSCIEVTCRAAVYHPGKLSTVSFILDMKSSVIRDLMKTHKVSIIQVESKGTLILPEVVKSIQPPQNKPDENITVTLIQKEGYKRISKWIFILSVVIGLLVLACIIFCLYSCGCFEQKKSKGDDAADGEEMNPLRNENGTQKEDEIREKEIRSSSYSIGDPPGFIPPHPTIPEETEEEDEEDEELKTPPRTPIKSSK